LLGGPSRIFRDREKLSPRYVPPILPHREKQIEELHSAFREALTAPSGTPLKTIQIIGPAGTGKTSCVLRFGERFEQQAARMKREVKHVYVNLKLQGGSRVVLYRYLLESAAPEVYSPGLSAEEMLRIMLRQLRENRKYLLISLDEIDYFIRSTKDTSVVYDLTRLNEIEPGKPCNVLGVIFTATATANLTRSSISFTSSLSSTSCFVCWAKLFSPALVYSSSRNRTIRSTCSLVTVTVR
jgi:cell division control protein 6